MATNDSRNTNKKFMSHQKIQMWRRVARNDRIEEYLQKPCSILVLLRIYHDAMWQVSTMILIALVARRSYFSNFVFFIFMYAIHMYLCLYRERVPHSMNLHCSASHCRFCVAAFSVHKQHITIYHVNTVLQIHPNSLVSLLDLTILPIEIRIRDEKKEHVIFFFAHMQIGSGRVPNSDVTNPRETFIASVRSAHE